MSKILTLWLAILLSATFCGGAPALGAPYRIQIVVRTAQNLHSDADVQRLVDWAAASGVETISLLVKQDEDRIIPSGKVYYASRLAPRAAGYQHFDVLASMLRISHARGIKVRAWMPQFHDAAAADAHPNWRMQTLLPRVNQDWNPRQSGQEWPPRFPCRAGGARPEGKPRRLREPF